MILSKINYKTNMIIAFLSLLLIFFMGCGGSKKEKKEPGKPAKTNAKSKESPKPDESDIPDVRENADLSKEIVEKSVKGETSQKIKKSGFTKEEMKEIGKDGYLSYFYRRKYSKDEIKIVWDAVNKLFPNYSKEDKLLATRSILAYHWVVYRTTLRHNMAANIKVTKKYRKMIQKYAKLHEVPTEMVEAIISWENSGSVSKTSWAECVGVGQLSQGAVDVAHKFYIPHIKKKELLVYTYRGMYNRFKFPLFHLAAGKHVADFDIYDVEGRHKQLAKKLKIRDERLIPSCNIEDAVVYLKLLYNNYGQRVDLAISTYHNGGLNNNDIIIDYLKRKSGGVITGKVTQKEIIQYLDKYKISFISLWKDHRSRDMLNGLRTVFGKITTSSNKRYALGDESDIYPWKVAAAYAALNASNDIVKKLIGKYYGPWDVAECRGLRIYDNYKDIRSAIKSGWLVKIPSTLYEDKGIGGLRGASETYYKKRSHYNYYATPELLGFLYQLNQVYRGRTKNKEIKVPIRAILESKVLEGKEGKLIPDNYKTHLQGVSIDVDLDNAKHKDILYRILKEFFLHDHIYFVRENGSNRACVNARYGKYYYDKYREWKKKNKK